LTAVANGSYQWLDCNNGNQPIPNATGQTFVPQNPGAYAVQITENGCTQSSACIDVLLTSVNEESIGNFYAFPNPTNNIITLSSPQFIKQIRVLDLSGQLILIVNNTNKADLSGLASGLYHLALEFDNAEVGHLKILKQ
jgi:hypothetical protein